MVTHDPFGLMGSAIENKHRIDHVVDEGGFAVVYRGYHLGFERPIAVKCLKVPPHFTGEAHALFLSKFREEGKHMARLSEHQSVVRVYDYGITRGPTGAEIPFLVLEWLEGMTLEAHLATRTKARLAPLGEGGTVALLRPAIEAIGFAHRLGIAHRDLKPANLFLARTELGEVVKVFDFGIAKAMQEGESATRIATKTTSGFSAFTPRYGAPEQFRTKKFGATGPWTDVHALGLIMVECAIGRSALEGEDDGDYFMASTAELRPTPRVRGVEVSDPFEQICAKSLALLPADRYRHAGDLLEALDALGPRLASAPVTNADRTVFEVPPSALASVMPSVASPYAAADAAEATVWPPVQAETRREPPAPAESPAPTEEPGAPAPAGTTERPSEPVAQQGGGTTERSGERTEPQAPAAGTVLSAVAGAAASVERAPEVDRAGALAPRAARKRSAGLLVGGALGLVGVVVALALWLGGGSKERGASAESGGVPSAQGTLGTGASGRPGAEPPSGGASGPGASAASAPAAAAPSCPTPMKLVAAGELQMGCAPSDASCLPPEKPLHKVPVKTFCMDETEVTVRDYRRCAEERGCSTEGLTSCRELGTWGAAGKDNHPIVCVSWQQADTYCRWAGKRLPTEEEWEYAARGQDLRLFPWGDEPPGHQICWKRWQKAQAEGEKDQREGTCPVDGHASASSPFGVLDMTGNVWEWTASDYRDGYDAPPMPAERAIRGGFWGSNSLTEVRVSSRNRLKPSKRYDSLGFRCAK